MRRLLSLVVCLLAITTAIAAATTKIPANVANGYYEGRSGNILVSPVTMERDMVALFVDKSERGYFERSAQEELSAFNVADVVTRSLGLTPVNSAYTPDFVSSNLFDRPLANVLISVDGLGANVVEELKLQQIKRIGAASTASLVYNSFPFSAVSLSASLASGVPASQHGIVAPAWEDNGAVEAFTAQAQPAAANVGDILASAFPKSLVISASANRQLAAAYCPQTVSATHECLALKGKDFMPLSGAASSPLSIGGAALSRAILEGDSVFATLPAASRVTVEPAQDGTIKVVYAGAERVQATFDLENPADYALFAELQYMANVADQLSEGTLNARVRDEFPDFIAFSISSLAAVAERYGAESPQYLAAAALVDATVPVLLNRLSALYSGRLVSEVLLLGSADTLPQTAELASTVSRVLPSVSLAAVPSFYLAAEPTAVAKACQAVEDAVPDAKVYCFPALRPQAFQSLSAHFTVQDTTGLRASNNSNSTFTDTDIQRYQIAMWFSIVFGIVLLYGFYSAAFMDFRKDTLLYGTFNPHWEDRKKH